MMVGWDAVRQRRSFRGVQDGAADGDVGVRGSHGVAYWIDS
jgi:hypothetical protein